MPEERGNTWGAPNLPVLCARRHLRDCDCGWRGEGNARGHAVEVCGEAGETTGFYMR